MGMLLMTGIKRRKIVTMKGCAMAIGKVTSRNLSTRGRNWRYCPIPEHIIHHICEKRWLHIERL
jgi:hypothetical protein